jgi:hypothetical protein
VIEQGSRRTRRSTPAMSRAWLWLGLAIMTVSEAGTLARVEPFWSWNTPIAWTGFILFADAVVFRARGNSWIRSSPREFLCLALLSIPLWLVFEAYNLILRNWYYSGLPEAFWLRQFGYAWSFATIWPAVFEGAELVAVARRLHPSVPPDPRHTLGLRDRPDRPGRPGRPGLPGVPGLLSAAAGVLMLTIPFVVGPDVARYMAAPVWLGFIFLLDPINARLGAESIAGDLAAGGFDRLINLVLSGFLCGGLWEFWNYWSRAKWHYTVPMMEHVKIFEMPLPGYLGFPAFALECFTMYAFVRRAFPGAGRTIAL